MRTIVLGLAFALVGAGSSITETGFCNVTSGGVTHSSGPGPAYWGNVCRTETGNLEAYYSANVSGKHGPSVAATAGFWIVGGVRIGDSLSASATASVQNNLELIAPSDLQGNTMTFQVVYDSYLVTNAAAENTLVLGSQSIHPGTINSATISIPIVSGQSFPLGMTATIPLISVKDPSGPFEVMEGAHLNIDAFHVFDADGNPVMGYGWASELPGAYTDLFVGGYEIPYVVPEPDSAPLILLGTGLVLLARKWALYPRRRGLQPAEASRPSVRSQIVSPPPARAPFHATKASSPPQCVLTSRTSGL